MKNIAILGSTGSIGMNSLRVIDSNPDEYRVLALAAGKNSSLLLEQIQKYNPVAVALADEDSAAILENRLRGCSGPEVMAGPEGMSRLAAMEETDTVISAITGAAGLLPTYNAIVAGKDVALANKETIVMAGPIIMEAAAKRKVSVLPIDSEHSAILQSLQGHPREDLRCVILTASGGPLRNIPLEKLKNTTPEEALRHPNWEMGKKISIDSATLMNKGLEAIEAKWLFSLNMDQIRIIIHPESIIHSMVEYNDGSIIAQMGIPDMITPISYALSYPRHRETYLPPLDFDNIGSLSFYKPDMARFRCLYLALKAAEIGDSMPAVLNGANEIAVNSFLKKRIGFLQIPEIIEKTMDVHHPSPVREINAVLEVDQWARQTAEKEIGRLLS